jgi:hypothetical protein
LFKITTLFLAFTTYITLKDFPPLADYIVSPAVVCVCRFTHYQSEYIREFFNCGAGFQRAFEVNTQGLERSLIERAKQMN